MHIPKRYGESKIDRCPFCQKQAFSKNRENIPVCADHKNEPLGELKCVCGEPLQMLEGKFGVFFNCIKCGNMNLRKVMEINQIESKGPIKKETMAEYNNESNKNDGNNNHSAKKNTETKKEITINSNDPRYFD